MATLRFKLLASLVSRGHYPRSITTWHLGIDPHFSYAWGAVLIPIGHENMSARRWPVITIGLILVNLLIFAGTHRTVDQQDSQLWKVEEHILILAATHPNLVLAPKAREFVDGFRSEFPDRWAELQNPNSDAV